jgi:hypothetical protein
LIKSINEASQLPVTKMVGESKILTADSSNLCVEAKAWYAMKSRCIMEEMKMAMAAANTPTLEEATILVDPRPSVAEGQSGLHLISINAV